MDFESHVDSAPKAPATVERFNALIKEAEDLNSQLIELDATYSQLLSRYNHIVATEMPQLMLELQTTEWVNENGTRVRIKDFIAGSLPKEPDARAKAIEWLEENGGKELIRSELVVPFSKSQHNAALAITDDIKKQGYGAELTSNVNAKQLQALGNAKLKAGEDLPLKLLGLFHDRVATIDHPKAKAPKKLGRKKGTARGDKTSEE